MTHVIGNDELPNNGTVYRFESCLYGDVDVSFFLSDTAPGKGPGLHAHPSDEGELTFTVGEATVEATSGEAVVVPAGAPHKFVNSGTGRGRAAGARRGPKGGEA